MNQDALLSTARRLEELFLKYSSASDDVAEAYMQCKPLLRRVMEGNIKPPSNERLPKSYFSSAFDLINYRDLYKTAALLDVYLEGWDSEEAYNSHMESVLGKAEQEHDELLKKST